MKPKILTYPSLQRLTSAGDWQVLCFVIQVVVSSSKGLACCNLCPPKTSFWTTDGSVNHRKVGVCYISILLHTPAFEGSCIPDQFPHEVAPPRFTRLGSLGQFSQPAMQVLCFCHLQRSSVGNPLERVQAPAQEPVGREENK